MSDTIVLPSLYTQPYLGEVGEAENCHLCQPDDQARLLSAYLKELVGHTDQFSFEPSLQVLHFKKN
ncbi:MAG: hypothetical protein KFF68_03425, partial [Desulfosarcina sp.]|nr:hypothetical protein [Desulfosarcina sp.]